MIDEMIDEKVNFIDSTAELALKGAAPVVVDAPDGRKFLIHHDSQTCKEVSDEHGLKLTRPSYIVQKPVVQTTDSLVDYVCKFKNPDTVLFADIATNVVTGVIDYHGVGQAEHLAHTVTMQLPYSEEWKTWTAQDGKLMSQTDFARFIEENYPDFLQPTASELLDIVKDLHGARKVNFTKSVRTDSENESFEYVVDNEVKTKGQIDMPTKFDIAIPVYFGETAVDLGVFLRWKIDEETSRLALGLKLHRREYVRQRAFQAIVGNVANLTSTLAIYGNKG